MTRWYVVSRVNTLYLVRPWQADDYEHAMEQHMDAFPEEELVCANRSEPMFYGSVLV